MPSLYHAIGKKCCPSRKTYSRGSRDHRGASTFHQQWASWQVVRGGRQTRAAHGQNLTYLRQSENSDFCHVAFERSSLGKFFARIISSLSLWVKNSRSHTSIRGRLHSVMRGVQWGRPPKNTIQLETMNLKIHTPRALQ